MTAKDNETQTTAPEVATTTAKETTKSTDNKEKASTKSPKTD